jgi:hypothetical protein
MGHPLTAGSAGMLPFSAFGEDGAVAGSARGVPGRRRGNPLSPYCSIR